MFLYSKQVSMGGVDFRFGQVILMLIMSVAPLLNIVVLCIALTELFANPIVVIEERITAYLRGKKNSQENP